MKVMNEKQLTAVEWVIKQLMGDVKDCENGIINQALEIERQQLIDFGNDCVELFHTDWDASTTAGEQMYKQKFEKP